METLEAITSIIWELNCITIGIMVFVLSLSFIFHIIYARGK